MPYGPIYNRKNAECGGGGGGRRRQRSYTYKAVGVGIRSRGRVFARLGAEDLSLYKRIRSAIQDMAAQEPGVARNVPFWGLGA